MKIVVVSGGFDPLHSGHINLLNNASKLGDKLYVGLNSDDWLTRKKGRPFMNWAERSLVISNLQMVDGVVSFDDGDDTAIHAIKQIQEKFPNDEIIFANGGDRTKTNIPEMVIEGVNFVFGIGGDNKANSSSWILREWKNPKVRRTWGEFSDLFQDDAVRVKELIIEPGQGISYQRHFKRSEIWFVSKGMINVKHSISQPEDFVIRTLQADDQIHIKQGQWHQAYNISDQPCHIIEIQYGEETTEDDIERLEYYNGEHT